jgi:hypothetical protein
MVNGIQCIQTLLKGDRLVHARTGNVMGQLIMLANEVTYLAGYSGSLHGQVDIKGMEENHGASVNHW